MVPRAVIDDFLAQKSLALVGVSRNGEGFGNVIRKELSAKGYELFVVHPEVERIGEQACVRSLVEVADRVGGVILVTPPSHARALVEECAALGIRRVWMQQGAESAEAIRFCEEHGIAAVHHACVLMFAEPAGWVHRAHRWFNGVTGHLPT
jgi:predicted CoA-binding protein